jgi:hypothetical protein
VNVLRDRNRSLPAAKMTVRRVRQTAHRLDAALERIERMLQTRRVAG